MIWSTLVWFLSSQLRCFWTCSPAGTPPQIHKDLSRQKAPNSVWGDDVGGGGEFRMYIFKNDIKGTFASQRNLQTSTKYCSCALQVRNKSAPATISTNQGQQSTAPEVLRGSSWTLGCKFRGRRHSLWVLKLTLLRDFEVQISWQDQHSRPWSATQ